MNLTIKTPNNISIVIDGNAVNNGCIELSDSNHHLRCEQNHYLYKKTWWTKLFNPFVFFGYVFFKDQFLSHSSYNSEAAVIEFNIVPKTHNAFLEIDLDYKYVNNNYTQQYSALSITEYRGLKVEHLKRKKPHSVFKKRWMLLRLIPTIIFSVYLILLSVYRFSFLIASIIYILLAIINAVRIVKNKPI